MVILDLALLVLTSCCVWYCYTLSNKIKSLQDTRDDFSKIIKYFDSVISRADISASKLNEFSGETELKLRDAISKAEILNKDLVFMHEIGSDLAQKMEYNISKISKLNNSCDNLDIKKSAKLDNDLLNATKNSSDKNSNQINAKSVDLDQDNDEHKNFSNVSKKMSYDSNSTSYYDTLKKLNTK